MERRRCDSPHPERPMKATLVYNPRAGRSLGSGGLGPAIEFLRREGWELSIQPSSGPGDATQIARAASAANDEVLLVAGGDGTLNEAVQGVAGSETALGYLPYGTMNVWARELHIPLNMSHAARAIARGHIERVDLGIANDRYFLLMAGIGFDSELIRRAKSLERHKPRFGILPYVLAGLATVPLYRGIMLSSGMTD
ncbi:MAG: diacylglycerol/lipid kinase family protein [Chloroflexota bacterium]